MWLRVFSLQLPYIFRHYNYKIGDYFHVSDNGVGKEIHCFLVKFPNMENIEKQISTIQM